MLVRYGFDYADLPVADCVVLGFKVRKCRKATSSIVIKCTFPECGTCYPTAKMRRDAAIYGRLA
jgi:hypothetical protein